MSPGHHSPYPQVRLQGQEREPTATPDPQRAPGQPRLRWGPGGGREAEGKGGETGERRREGGRRRGKFGGEGQGSRQRLRGAPAAPRAGGRNRAPVARGVRAALCIFLVLCPERRPGQRPVERTVFRDLQPPPPHLRAGPHSQLGPERGRLALKPGLPQMVMPLGV